MTVEYKVYKKALTEHYPKICRREAAPSDKSSKIELISFYTLVSI